MAISHVAAAVERKVWVRTMGSFLYPNLFTILVGPPGIGKGVAIHPAERILREVPDLHVGPSDLTSASLIDSLSDAVRRHIQLNASQPYVEFNSLTVISRELGVLIPAWDTSLMNALTDIYDGFTVDQRRRGKDLHIKIKDPQINLLGACTPSYLNEVLPAGAWDQGFLSRTILVYSGDKIIRDPFAEDTNAALTMRVNNDLLHDLKTIAQEFGQMSFTTPAAMAIKAWVKGGLEPAPAHQKLQYYNSRRLAHLLKLSMISSISRSGEKVIGLDHYAEALNWLIEAETYMPDIFKSMVGGGDSNSMEEAWNYVWVLYGKEKRPIAEHRVVHFLRERVPAHSVMRVLEIMVKSRMLEISIEGNGFQGYKPTSRESRLTGS